MTLLPITDFQFVFCGFATFAATVGYACARRRSSINQETAPVIEGTASSATSQEHNSPSSKDTALDEKPSSDTEPMSLKRKSTDDHQPSDRPRKRSRSPSNSVDRDNKSTVADSPRPLEAVLPTVTQPTCADSGDFTMNPETPPVAQDDFKLIHYPIKESTGVEAEVVTMPITPRASPSPAKRVRGFAAFAGAGSPFNANGAATVPSPQRPVWCSSGNSFDAKLSTENSTSKTDDATVAETFGTTNCPSPLGAAFGPNQLVAEASALTATPGRVQTTVAHLTGEEDEVVKSELKGVKLFIKRGAKGFTGGMPGHVKLLSHTQNSEERLLFRREPLWKVSMNVRVQPAVRCTFDSEDNVLRIVLKEAVEHWDGSAATRPQELVVYALKRGRVSKKDFKEFAEALVANSLFQSATTSNENTT